MHRTDFVLLSTWDTGSIIFSTSISSDGTRIASGSDDHAVNIRDAQTGLVTVGPLTGHTNQVRSVAFSPDGTRVVSGSCDNTIRIWDAQSGLALGQPLRGHTNIVCTVAFSPDGARVVSGSEDKTLRVWDAIDGALSTQPLQGHTASVFSAAFSPDGTRIVSGSADTTLRIWDAHSGDTVVGPLRQHNNTVQSVAFSPDGTRIVSGSHSSTICVWDAYEGTVLVGPLKGHTGPVLSVAFSPDGAQIVSGAYGDGEVRIWDAQSGMPTIEPLEGHTSSVFSVAFSPDNTRIVSGSADKTIRSWGAPQKTHSKPVKIASSKMVPSLSYFFKFRYHLLCLKSTHEMFDCLVQHGCTDLSLLMDPNQYSSVAIAGGGFGDVWQGKMLDGTKVAIKCLRLHTIAADGIKGFKVCASYALESYLFFDRFIIRPSVRCVSSIPGRKQATKTFKHSWASSCFRDA